MSNSNAPAPIAQFLQSVTNARYDDYVHRSTTKVQDAKKFEEMRLYIITLYTGAHVASTYVLDGQVFDCIVTSSKKVNPPSPASAPSASLTSSGPSNASNLAACKEGTVPMERVTLDRIVQFSTLEAFLAKSPGGSSLPPVPPPPAGKK